MKQWSAIFLTAVLLVNAAHASNFNYSQIERLPQALKSIPLPQEKLHIKISDIPQHLMLSSYYQLKLPLSKVTIELDHKISKTIAVKGGHADASFTFKELKAAYGHGTHTVEYVRLTYFFGGFGKVAEYKVGGQNSKQQQLTCEGDNAFKIGYMGVVNPNTLRFRVASAEGDGRLAMNF